MYKNEMKFHMLMFMNAWIMLVLMKCKCQMPFSVLSFKMSLRLMFVLSRVCCLSVCVVWLLRFARTEGQELRIDSRSRS